MHDSGDDSGDDDDEDDVVKDLEPVAGANEDESNSGHDRPASTAFSLRESKYISGHDTSGIASMPTDHSTTIRRSNESRLVL